MSKKMCEKNWQAIYLGPESTLAVHLPHSFLVLLGEPEKKNIKQLLIPEGYA